MDFTTSILIQNVMGNHRAWIDLPSTKEEILATLNKSQINDKETFIPVDYESELHLRIDWKVHNLKELLEFNEIYKEFDNLLLHERMEVAAALEYEEESLKDTIAEVKKHNFIFRDDIEDEYDLGKLYAEEEGLPYCLGDYFDYEKYGKDCAKEEGGIITYYGYIKRR